MSWDLYHSRVRCPHCFSLNVQDVEDKSVVLYYDTNGSRIYAKRKQCKDCKHIWKN